jgi:hypothetical protein
MSKTTARTPASQMVPIAEYLKTLEATAACLRGHIAVKGPNAALNPTNLRTIERTMIRNCERLIAQWGTPTNRKSYDLQFETSQAQQQGGGTTTKARRAGA